MEQTNAQPNDIIRMLTIPWNDAWPGFTRQGVVSIGDNKKAPENGSLPTRVLV